jgi:cell division protein ZapA (FtsZ GTPase activity inhibitor)
MAYKISKDSEAELRRAVNNFNSKVKRLESVDREIDIPEKASITAIKDRVTNKWELNREIDKLERFTQRNAEELVKNKSGVVLSRWEFENLQKEQRRLSARLTREIERYGNITPKAFGEKQSATYAQMGDEKLSNLKARQRAISNKSLSKVNREQLKSLQTLINKTNANYRSTKKQTYYNNYLDGSLLNLGYFIDYDEEKLQYIREKLGELTPDQFIKAFNEEGALRDMQDRYAIMHEEGVSPDKLSEEVTPLLDEVYNNIDKIVETYK